MQDPRIGEVSSHACHEYASPLEAYLAEDYVTPYAMECEPNTYEDEEGQQ